MTYGKAKERDMIRSVLPSSARKAARMNLATAKRHGRRNIRQALNLVAIDPEVWDGSPTDYVDYPYEAIRDAVSERRGHDKVSALQAWAPSQVKHLRLEDRLSYMAGLLPNSTIGRHALSHIDFMDEFYVPDTSDAWWRRRMASVESRGFANACAYATLEDKLRTITASARVHKRFNTFMKVPLVVTKRVRLGNGKYEFERLPDDPGRPLLGVHDLTDFIKHNTRNEDRVKRLRNALDKILAGE